MDEVRIDQPRLSKCVVCTGDGRRRRKLKDERTNDFFGSLRFGEGLDLDEITSYLLQKGVGA